jgi:hypothetical protein
LLPANHERYPDVRNRGGKDTREAQGAANRLTADEDRRRDKETRRSKGKKQKIKVEEEEGKLKRRRGQPFAPGKPDL